ncbi:aldehyde dehydrogenase [Pseudonocardia sp. ICBG1122]|nr:aldehyde dehydrogenase [Pseudonocardia pini]
MSTTTYDRLYIGGAWVAPSASERIEVVNASTEEPIGSVPEAAEADVDRAVSAARAAFDAPDGWSSWAPQDRADAMEALAVALEKRAPEMAERVSAQNGMPVALSSRLETGFPVMLLRYYSGLAVAAAADEQRAGLLGGSTLVRRLPVGVVGAIVPWNYPQTLAFSKLAPALAAGCTVVMKPSPETVLDGFLLAEALAEAGIPAGVLNLVPGGREIGAYLVAHPDVDKVAFTGSTTAGIAVAQACAQRLRPVSLELGGKSAAIMLDDVDLNSRFESFYTACLANNGQTCYLGTRILAPRSRYDEIVDQITGFVAGLPVGDALDPATLVGPMASARHRDRVESYIEKGRSEARVTTGGGRPAGLSRGWFVEPTVFADVDNRSVIAQEEIFGPVLAVIPYGDDDEAVQLANDSDYGLGGSVWTGDPERGTALARRVRTGTIGVNGYLPEPTAPFGGVKNSGLGREFGPEGLAGYLQTQSIYLSA